MYMYSVSSECISCQFGNGRKFVRVASPLAIIRAASVNSNKYARKVLAGRAQAGFEHVTRPFADIVITTKLPYHCKPSQLRRITIIIHCICGLLI